MQLPCEYFKAKTRCSGMRQVSAVSNKSFWVNCETKQPFKVGFRCAMTQKEARREGRPNNPCSALAEE